MRTTSRDKTIPSENPVIPRETVAMAHRILEAEMLGHDHPVTKKPVSRAQSLTCKDLLKLYQTQDRFTPEQRAAERQKMIEAGYLNPDGTPNLTVSARAMPEAHRPTRSPQEVAASLRASDAHARHGGAPISRHHIEEPAEDIGDVL